MYKSHYLNPHPLHVFRFAWKVFVKKKKKSVAVNQRNKNSVPAYKKYSMFCLMQCGLD